jgi:hypothetical protein
MPGKALVSLIYYSHIPIGGCLTSTEADVVSVLGTERVAAGLGLILIAPDTPLVARACRKIPTARG